MGCRRAWNDEFLDMNFTKAFRTGAYKKHREDILLEREIAILPTRQPRVEATLKTREILEKMKKVNEELYEWEKKRQEILKVSSNLSRGLTRYTAESEGRAPPAWTLTEGEAKSSERAKFVMKCPFEDCRGFLSTAYKCGTCQQWACPDCLVIKGKDKDVEHTCDPGVKETVALIIKESKPCPKCGERISKIDGCFAENTPILLWDSTLKMSQDICVGDELVGDNGEKRIVQEICSGEDELFEVTQTRGVSYTVNSKHTLVFKSYISVTEHTKGWIVKWIDSTLSNKSKIFSNEHISERNEFIQSLPNVLEIVVEDYMKLPNAVKDNLYAYKSTDINWTKNEVLLDPYIMGLWIGDGINNGTDFACCAEKDPEIIKSLLDWCNMNECELVHDDIYRFRVRRAGISSDIHSIGRGSTSATCKGCVKKTCNMCDIPIIPFTHSDTTSKKNPLKEILNYYNLIQNKHIPEEYMMNDRDTRLQLLAGIIDTDGYLGSDGKRIQIPQVNHAIGKQIEILARSLGFVVSVDILRKDGVTFPGTAAKDYSPQYRVSISGQTISDIPTRVLRKKCVDSNPNKDWMKTSIHVKGVGRGIYYGWNVGDNHRFVLSDMTVTKNCDQMWCIDCHTAFSWATGQLVNGVVHNPHYYEFLRQQGNGVAPRNAGDVPCGGVPYYHHLQTNITQLDRTTQNTIMAIHRMTAEITDFRLAVYQGQFNVNDNGDLGVAYLMKEMTKDQIKVELAKRELKRNKHLAIRAILEMFVNTSTMMLNNIVSQPPGDTKKQKISGMKSTLKKIQQESLDSIKFLTMLKEESPSVNPDTVPELITLESMKIVRLEKQCKDLKAEILELEKNLMAEVKTEFEPTLAAFANLRIYVNDSLMGVSRMKNCSVPQINATWQWVPFNKTAVKAKVKKETPVAADAAS
jgi:hypothetical protein